MRSDYTPGRAQAWAFRWISACKLGHYVVTVMVENFVQNFDAVVDDFGNLIKVPE